MERTIKQPGTTDDDNLRCLNGWLQFNMTDPVTVGTEFVAFSAPVAFACFISKNYLMSAHSI